MLEQQAHREESEVSWPLDSTTLYGTLVRPEGRGPFPAVVMVAGSGPTDRDWNSPLLPGSNGSGRLMAEALLDAGVASLRYDKRASGPHAMENVQALVGKVSMQSHVEELEGAARTLASQSYARPDRIFALTNSEGALHALNYQLGNPEVPFAGLVLTAPPGRPVGAVGRSQIVALLSPLPNGDQMITAYDAAVARFLAGEPVEPDPSLPQTVQMLLQSLASPVNLPFSRELWTIDAAELLARIRVPVLVVIGKKDIQVDWQADGEPLQRAVEGQEDVTFVFPENANHILKHETRPRSDLTAMDATGYNAPGTGLDPEVVRAIIGWLKTHS